MAKYLFYTIGIISLLGCDKGSKVAQDTFDRKAMLQEVAQQLIKPSFSALKVKVDSLFLLIDAFAQSPNTTTLGKAQLAWQNTYTAYQAVCIYNFGAAGEEGLRKSLVEEIATFPVSATKIENTVANNNANFNDFNRDARGFLAIEYLLFDLANNQTAIIANFQNQNRKSYLIGLGTHLQTRVNEVVASWEGAYLPAFVANDGTSAGSSTSLLYNEFVKSFEGLKNFKVALPLGKRAGQTQTEPARVEAYYSGMSLQMLKAHFDKLEKLWRKFIPYLQSVEGGNALIGATQAQLTAAKNALYLVPVNVSLASQIQNAPAAFENAYIELQKLTRYFKSDMSSVLGIAITYTSGDGD